jgi:hypothetical protein
MVASHNGVYNTHQMCHKVLMFHNLAKRKDVINKAFNVYVKIRLILLFIGREKFMITKSATTYLQ